MEKYERINIFNNFQNRPFNTVIHRAKCNSIMERFRCEYLKRFSYKVRQIYDGTIRESQHAFQVVIIEIHAQHWLCSVHEESFNDLFTFRCPVRIL